MPDYVAIANLIAELWPRKWEAFSKKAAQFGHEEFEIIETDLVDSPQWFVDENEAWIYVPIDHMERIEKK